MVEPMYFSNDEGKAGLDLKKLTVLTKDQLLDASPAEKKKLLNSGLCVGLSLSWLQQLVLDCEMPKKIKPSLRFARSLQDYYEEHRVPAALFPRMGYMENEGLRVWHDLDDALAHVHRADGAYMVLIAPRNAPDSQKKRTGHAVAVCNAAGVLHIMNQNAGLLRVSTVRDLVAAFTADPIVDRIAHKANGYVIFTIKVGKLRGKRPTSCVELQLPDPDPYLRYVTLTGVRRPKMVRRRRH